jgi:hypothetical protein
LLSEVVLGAELGADAVAEAERGVIAEQLLDRGGGREDPVACGLRVGIAVPGQRGAGDLTDLVALPTGRRRWPRTGRESAELAASSESGSSTPTMRKSPGSSLMP